jgi:Phosphotransferase enzyme family
MKHPQGSDVAHGLIFRRLPETEEDVTPEWLTQALAPHFAGRTLLRCTIERIIPGTATKILMDLDYSASATEPAIRTKVCVKGAFDPAIRAYDLGTIFACEAAFYRDVGSRLDVALPRCFYADEDGKFGVMVLENLLASGATFGDIRCTWSPDKGAGLLKVLARVHAFGWDWKPGVLPWLQGSNALRDGIRGMAAPEKFQSLIARPEIERFLPPDLRDRDYWLATMHRLWQRDDNQTLCLGHGDAHLGQTYLDADGTPGLLDWQCAGLMPWAKDVAYFIGGALSVEDRRAHERELLNGYLEALEESGGPRIEREQAWEDYRRQMLQGICWTLVTEQMQPLDAISAMNERYLTAITDLGTLELLRKQ